MARVKQSIIQRDFSLGAVREDFIERQDLEARNASLRECMNVRVLASGAIEARPGLVYKFETDPDDILLTEFRGSDGIGYSAHIKDNVLFFSPIINPYGTIFLSGFPQVDLSNASFAEILAGDRLWYLNDGDSLILGNEIGIIDIKYEPYRRSGDVPIFSASIFEFEKTPAAGGDLLTRAPFWVFEKGVTITPSALTGNITVEFSQKVFEPDELTTIRYMNKQIELTSYASGNTFNATVIEELPPTFRIGVSNASEFRSLDSVISQDTGFEGQIIRIGSGFIDVVAISFFAGPDIGEIISSNSTSRTVSSKATIAPGPSVIWDELLMSSVRGYPGSASLSDGRLTLADFPQAPDAIALSSSRSIKDFELGLADDDAIVRSMGNDKPSILHVVAANDLIILTNKGCYVQDLGGGSPLTPANFNPVLFDRRGCNRVEPVQVADGVVFVEANNETVSAAFQDGTVVVKWTVRSLTTLHDQLITTPQNLCAPSLDIPQSENYLLVVNGDGTIAAMSYSETLSEPGVGIVPWSTQGAITVSGFRRAVPMFGQYWAVVSRFTSEGIKSFVESFQENAFLDGSGIDGFLGSPLKGQNLTVYQQGKSSNNTYEIGNDGLIVDDDGIDPGFQIGLPFEAYASPWAIENITSPRVGTLDVRCIRFLISVETETSFQVKCNEHIREIGGISFGDEQSNNDPSRDFVTIAEKQRYAIPVFGIKERAELSVIKNRPGPFRVLYLGQEVQA